MDEIKREKNESPSSFRARYRRAKGLGTRKRGSAKAQNMHKEASHTGVCLVCCLNRLDCICAGHMSEVAKERFREEQKKAPTPKQAGFG